MVEKECITIKLSTYNRLVIEEANYMKLRREYRLLKSKLKRTEKRLEESIKEGE